MGGEKGERRRQAERGRCGCHNAGGEARELSEPEWTAAMWGWAGKELGGECHGRCDSGALGVEVVGQGLVEFEVGDGVGLGGRDPHPTQRALRGGRESRWRGMMETTGGSVRNARILISRAQAGQSSGSTS